MKDGESVEWVNMCWKKVIALEYYKFIWLYFIDMESVST